MGFVPDQGFVKLEPMVPVSVYHVPVSVYRVPVSVYRVPVSREGGR